GSSACPVRCLALATSLTLLPPPGRRPFLAGLGTDSPQRPSQAGPMPASVAQSPHPARRSRGVGQRRQPACWPGGTSCQRPCLQPAAAALQDSADCYFASLDQSAFVRRPFAIAAPPAWP